MRRSRKKRGKGNIHVREGKEEIRVIVKVRRFKERKRRRRRRTTRIEMWERRTEEEEEQKQEQR